MGLRGALWLVGLLIGASFVSAKDIDIDPENVITLGGDDGNLKFGGDAPLGRDDEDVEVIVEGEEAPIHAFTEDDLESIKSKSEEHSFNADVYKVMNILTHSLYSNREIFLREVISNSVDALDRVRYLHLTEGKPDGALEIRVRADLDAQTLTITDTGDGMNRSALIENLGTVAQSGTSKFLNHYEEAQNNVQLIGQFGVGFYSNFLVADEVTVVSKPENGDQHIWKSTADGQFTVVKDPRGNTMERGTSLILSIKDDATEFLEEERLRSTIKRYSEFMTHPIYLYTKKETTEQVPIEKEESEEEEAAEDDEDLVIKDEDFDEEEEEEEEFRTIKKVIFEWEQLNTQMPIWTRSKSDITEEEYTNFYHALANNEYESPLTHTHFSAEGEIDFKSILYIPESAPYGLYEDYYQKKSSLRLYVRRVLINDKFEDFIPNYLHFVKGLVDSHDLPLNVNREQLQKSKIMKVISKKLTRKVLEMIKKMAEKSEPEDEEDEEEEEPAPEDELADGDDGEDVEKDEDDEKEKTKYFKFWENFGKSIKMGLLEEESRNRNILKKLLRFPSSKGDEHPISIDTYIARMDDKQKGIFYISGESIESVQNSPSLEKVKKAGYEVLYFIDPLDEYILRQLSEYEGIKLMSVTTENLALEEDSEAKRARWEEIQAEHKPLTDWFKDLLRDRVTKVEVSKRLDQSPCILVSTQYGPSVRMERIQKSQPLSRGANAQISKKVLELNHRHPIVQELKSRVESLDEEEEASADLLEYAEMLYDSALLSGGYTHDDPASFATRINRLLRTGLGVSHDAEVDPEEEFDDEEEVQEEDEEAEILDDTDYSHQEL